MAGIDWFLLIAPILMLGVCALFAFLGCDSVLGLNPTILGVPLQAAPGFPPAGTRITPVDVSWDTVSGADHYIVLRGIAPGPESVVGQTTGLTYSDDSVTDGTTYYYDMLAYQGTAVVGAASSSPPSVTPQPPFVTSFNTLGGVLNNFGGFIGMAVLVGGTPVTVYALGRLMVTGNNGSHELRMVDGSNNSTLGSVLVNMAGGTVGSFVYGRLTSPITLAANATYFIVSAEQNGGDGWHDPGTTLLTTNVATVTSSVVGDGVNFTQDFPGRAYVPLDFLYQ
jgi:hypothetical protein